MHTKIRGKKLLHSTTLESASHETVHKHLYSAWAGLYCAAATAGGDGDDQELKWERNIHAEPESDPDSKLIYGARRGY